jgi:hypothetical protein
VNVTVSKKIQVDCDYCPNLKPLGRDSWDTEKECAVSPGECPALLEYTGDGFEVDCD